MSKYILLDLSDEEYDTILKIIDRVKETGEKSVKILKRGQLEIDSLKRKVLREEKEISLTAKEFSILFLLASYPEVVFSHRQIYESVWGEDSFCDEANITAHIGHIRKKIESNPRNPLYIQTVRGVGYKFAKQKDK